MKYSATVVFTSDDICARHPTWTLAECRSEILRLKKTLEDRMIELGNEILDEESGDDSEEELIEKFKEENLREKKDPIDVAYDNFKDYEDRDKK